ncbi:hypothetical protein [Streptomyces sp. PTD5-9]|uniref:hypothetical protein n=1 Tax=Streptomyces sp. PTD5-9 TaxID=3120150 RepID=UPI0030087420
MTRATGVNPVDLDPVRQVADAVLYEGYLLYPYRAGARKNRSRWQFGVLGPPSAAPGSFAEEPGMAMECLLSVPSGARAGAGVSVRLRFLQHQVRRVRRRDADGGHTDVPGLTVAGVPVLSWDEAVEREVDPGPVPLAGPSDRVCSVPGGEETEPLVDADGMTVGQIVRRRERLAFRVRTRTTEDDGFLRLSVSVDNEHAGTPADKESALRVSLLGAHLLLRAHGGAEFVSLREPPEAAAAAASRCEQRRCWPVLAGPQGSADTVLGAPIILYDHPEIAEQSPGALFDSTEIDEILTLRIMTMTDEEKAEARATDPRAREIVDRCDAMTPEELRLLHGLLRDPGGNGGPRGTGSPRGLGDPGGPDGVDCFDGPGELDGPVGPGDPSLLRDGTPPPPAVAAGERHEAGPDASAAGGAPWWDPAAGADGPPGTDAVVIDGVRVARDSLVRVRPSRRADAQDLFFAGRVARVTNVLRDVDGGTHVALLLVDDPAADLHDWYGRSLYFAPDELEPLPAGDTGRGVARPSEALKESPS